MSHCADDVELFVDRQAFLEGGFGNGATTASALADQ
jgi:hypothetical protein